MRKVFLLIFCVIILTSCINFDDLDQELSKSIIESMDPIKMIVKEEKKLNIAKVGGDKGEEADALFNLGMSYFQLGDFQKALNYFDKTMKAYSNFKYKDKDKEVVETSIFIGMIYEELGDFNKAFSYYEEALQIQRERKSLLDSKKDKGVSRKLKELKGKELVILINIAKLSFASGDYSLASSYVEKAMKLWNDEILPGEPEEADVPYALSPGLSHPEGFETDFAIGDLYLKMKNFAEAKKAYDYAYNLWHDFTNKILENRFRNEPEFKDKLKKQREEGILSNTLKLANQLLERIIEERKNRSFAKYFLETGDYAKAIEYADKTIYDPTISLESELKVLYGCKALACSKLMRDNESITSYLNMIEIIEKIRGSLKEAEQKKAFFEKQVNPYEEIISPIYRLYKKGEKVTDSRVSAKAYGELGFHFAENTRARNFLEQLAERLKESLTADLPASLKEKEKKLKEDIISLKEQLESALKESKEKYNQKQTELKEAEARFEEFVNGLRKTNPEYANIVYPKPLDVNNIPLKEGETLIEFEVSDDGTFVFVIRMGRVEKFILIPVKRDELKEKIKSFRTAFEKQTPTLYKQSESFSLYNLLLKDVLAGIPKGEKLIIIPDEVLETLPFEMLLTSEKGPYLDELYSISYYPSATVLALQMSKSFSKSLKSLFGVADPVFDESDPRAKGIKLASSSYHEDMTRSLRRFDTDSGGAFFQRLPGTREELSRISKMMDNPALNFDLDASEEKVKSTDLKPYRYIHFATHGILANDLPYIQQPALVLSQVKKDENNDGFLTLGEVLSLKMNADVVALSACKTGLGKEEKGEGVSTLSRAFMYSGARALLVSLWSVSDVSTAIFMEEFYKNLKSGKTKSEAIKLARTKLRQNPKYQNPFFWAPFILIGE